MKHKASILAAVITLPACGTVDGVRSDAESARQTAAQMIREFPPIPLPNLPQLEASPFTEATEEVQAYCRAIAERWEFGKDEVKIGGDMLAEGQARVEKGKQIVREGERKIETASLTLNETRRELALRTGRAIPDTRDYARMSDPELVRTLRNRLETAVRRMEDGGAHVTLGASEIETGQARADEGIQRIKRGHALMAEDTGRCRELQTRIVTVGDPVLGEEDER